MLLRFLKIKTNFRIPIFPYFLISLFPLWGLGGCSSSPKPHNSNSFQEEYPDGTVKKECKFIAQLNETHYLHHCKLYHPNGNLKEEGDFINDTIATGWHTYYRGNNTIKARREYLQLTPGMIYLNRVIRFEINGDTDKTFSNYYSIYFDKDTVAEGGFLLAHFKLEAPYFKKSYIVVNLTPADGEQEVLPTDYSLLSHQAIKVTAQKGKYELKGYMEEIEKLEQTGDTMKVRKRPLYFNKPYWVE